MDLQEIDFSYDHSAEADASSAYDQFEHQISQVVDRHAQIKRAYQRRKKRPCMNSSLKKKDFFAKKKFFNEYQKNRNSKTWKQYGAQRNLVKKLKKKSINTYFQERCIGGAKSENFWKIIKSYLSKKSTTSLSKVVLSENNKLITNQNEVSQVFNSFFINVSNDIGKGVSSDEKNHPSICKIKENLKHVF